MSRQGCHLCEQAESWLAGTGHAWIRLDLDQGDPAAIEALALPRGELSEMVPVLFVDGQVLGWGRLDPLSDGVRLDRALAQAPGSRRPW